MINQQNRWPIKVFNKRAAITGWLLKFLGYTVIAVSLLPGCEERQCPKKKTNTNFMPDSQKALVPYETGDTLVFLFNLSGAKDTVTFTGEKSRRFKEESELWGNCGFTIQKYEQFHYNFYSEDSVHHLKVVNRAKYNDILTNVNKKGRCWLYANTIKNKNDKYQKIVINNKKYKSSFIDTFQYSNNKLYQVYNLKYGLLLYKINNINTSYSLLKYK